MNGAPWNNGNTVNYYVGKRFFMIPFSEALEITLGRARTLGSTTVPLSEAAGRVLAQDVACDVDMPPFNKSAMDGYACRRADLPGPLKVVETIQAGKPPEKPVCAKECAKIMTGAMVPEGADCVIMVEHTQTNEDGHVVFTRESTATNICYCGEDVKAGATVLRRGIRIAPQHIAVLAAAGCSMPLVAQRPRVAVVATGDELVEPDTLPGPSQIRNTNSHQIRAQMEQTGAQVTYYGIGADTLSALNTLIQEIQHENEVLLLSGGVSMGDYDLVPQALTENGFEILFDAIAMKPGKPTTFAVSESAACFGLPGNPVSTFVQGEILVKPFLYALMGHTYRPHSSWHPLAESFTRKKTEREAWIPVMVDDNDAICPISYHGSAHIAALCDAYGFMTVPQGVASIPEGAMMRVMLIVPTG